MNFDGHPYSFGFERKDGRPLSEKRMALVLHHVIAVLALPEDSQEVLLDSRFGRQCLRFSERIDRDYIMARWRDLFGVLYGVTMLDERALDGHCLVSWETQFHWDLIWDSVTDPKIQRHAKSVFAICQRVSPTSSFRTDQTIVQGENGPEIRFNFIARVRAQYHANQLASHLSEIQRDGVPEAFVPEAFVPESGSIKIMNPLQAASHLTKLPPVLPAFLAPARPARTAPTPTTQASPLSPPLDNIKPAAQTPPRGSTTESVGTTGSTLQTITPTTVLSDPVQPPAKRATRSQQRRLRKTLMEAAKANRVANARARRERLQQARALERDRLRRIAAPVDGSNGSFEKSTGAGSDFGDEKSMGSEDEEESDAMDWNEIGSDAERGGMGPDGLPDDATAAIIDGMVGIEYDREEVY